MATTIWCFETLPNSDIAEVMGLKLAFQFDDNIDFQCFVSQGDSLKVIVEMKVKSKNFA